MNNNEHISADEFQRKYKSWDEIKQAYTSDTSKAKVHHQDREHQLQAACYDWFIKNYTGLYRLLFAIPNGGQRNIRVAHKLALEGVVKGVADMFLSVPSNGYHGLYIEMKTLVRSSRQKPEQKEFEDKVTAQGYAYRICRSKEEFEDLIITYLNNELSI